MKRTHSDLNINDLTFDDMPSDEDLMIMTQPVPVKKTKYHKQIEEKITSIKKAINDDVSSNRDHGSIDANTNRDDSVIQTHNDPCINVNSAQSTYDDLIDFIPEYKQCNSINIPENFTQTEWTGEIYKKIKKHIAYKTDKSTKNDWMFIDSILMMCAERQGLYKQIHQIWKLRDHYKELARIDKERLDELISDYKINEGVKSRFIDDVSFMYWYKKRPKNERIDLGVLTPIYR